MANLAHVRRGRVILSHRRCSQRRFAAVNPHTNSSTYPDIKNKLTDVAVIDFCGAQAGDGESGARATSDVEYILID